MHLSLLSDSFLSDRLNDAGIRAEHEAPSAGRAHRDGVIRGICFIAVLALPVILTVGTPVADRTTLALSAGNSMATHAGSLLPASMGRRS